MGGFGGNCCLGSKKGLGTQVGEQGAKGTGEIHPEEGRQAAKASIATSTATPSRGRSPQVLRAHRLLLELLSFEAAGSPSGQPCPVAREELIRRGLGRRGWQKICSCGTLHETVLDGRPVAEELIVVVIIMLLACLLHYFQALALQPLHGAGGPVRRQQVPEAGVGEVV